MEVEDLVPMEVEDMDITIMVGQEVRRRITRWNVIRCNAASNNLINLLAIKRNDTIGITFDFLDGRHRR